MVDGTVFVVDDDQAVRNSLELVLTSVGIRCEVFASAQEFLRRYQPNGPGCLVLDIRMPEMSGLELQRTLKERGAEIPIIFVTAHADVPIAVRALREGALEFLEKPFSKGILLEHVRDALKRDAENRQEAALRLDLDGRLQSLTEREREVMGLVVAGRLSKQIAADLGISKKTVDVHRARVMQKMQVDSLPELVRVAIEAHFDGVDTSSANTRPGAYDGRGFDES